MALSLKVLTLADWTGMVETELFAQTYKSYGLATVRYPVLKSKRASNHSRTRTVFPCAYCGLANRERWRVRGENSLRSVVEDGGDRAFANDRPSPCSRRGASL